MNALELILLAAIWGASFLFMRIGAPEFGPIPLIALRVGIATLVLLPALRTAQARQQFRAHRLPLFIVGVTNSAIPFSLFAYSTLYLNAGFDSILNATTPLWGALIARLWLKMPLSRSQGCGLLTGLAGVTLLVSGKLGAGQDTTLPAALAALLAAFLYGVAGNYSRRLTGVAPLVTAWGSQFFATLILLPPALVYWPHQPVSAAAWGAVAALGVLCTGAAYILYFRLLVKAGAAYAMAVTFLVPVFGLLWGAVFLDERITPATLAGCAIVLVGLGLTTGKIKGWRFARAS
jgi:drug/metabolite transporter (DMT)-like permease